MKEINILCFGDSLTEGYSMWGRSMWPYADEMTKRLEAAWPSTKLTVDVNGLSGDLVTKGLCLTRINSCCHKSKAKKKYDWVIILGGTNDLGHGLDPDDIFAGLEEIYEVALDHGASILALTVPECASVSKSLDERRSKLNKLIKEHKSDRFHILDFYDLMPYHDVEDEELRDEIWDDGLHFTHYGYDVMGDHVANRLVELMAESQGQTSLETKKNDAEEGAPSKET